MFLCIPMDNKINCFCRMKIKIGIKDIILFLLIFLPFADAANGFVIDKYQIYGIGESYHAIMIVFGFLYLFKRKIKSNGYYYTLLICVVSLIIQICITIFLDEDITSISRGRVIKILTTVMFIVVFNKLSQNISAEEFSNIALWQCKSIISITLFADLTGICNYTYSDRGRIGLYAGSNEPTIIFIVLLTILLWFVMKTRKTEHLIWFALCELCLVMTESKSAIAMAAAYAILLLLVNIKDLSGKHKSRAILLLLVTIIVSIVGILYFKYTVLDSFMYRQRYISSRLGKKSYLNYLTSGRMYRFDRLIGQPFSDVMSNNPVFGYIIIFIKILFGFGLSGAMTSTFEMDYLDIFVYGGVIWTFLIVRETIVISKLIMKKQKSRIIKLSFIIILMASFFVGHMWTGGNSGIYFSMISIFLTKYGIDQNRREKIQ